jgi:hypothetical protein
MNDDLYARFSAALRALPETDPLATLDRVLHVIEHACRTTTGDAVFVPVGMTGQPVEPVLRVLAGRRVRELGEVWVQLRWELADELAKQGADPDVVREFREGRPRPDEDGHPLRPSPDRRANDVVAESDVSRFT